jgi:hypothetical protein
MPSPQTDRLGGESSSPHPNAIAKDRLMTAEGKRSFMDSPEWKAEKLGPAPPGPFFSE